MGKSSKKPKFDTAPTPVQTTKKVKEGMRGSDEELDKQASPKEEKVEVEQMALTKKKIKKLKKDMSELSVEKKEEKTNSAFEGEVSAAPTVVSQTKVAKKGNNEDETEKQESSKKRETEVEKLVQSNKKIKKLKKTLIKSSGKMKDENYTFDFREETAVAPIIISQIKAAKKGKRGNEDEADNQGCSKKQIIEVEEVDNKRMESLTVKAENKKTSQIFENEPKAPAAQDEKSGAKRLFVGNLSPEVTKDDLLELFKEAGEVIDIQLAAKGDGSFRGFGHVEFSTAADVQKALGMNYQLLLGRRVMIDFAVEKGSNNPPKGKSVQDSAHCIYVKGFGKSLGEDQIRNSLKEHFGSCGEIIRVSIPQDNKTGRSKGFAYILFNGQAGVSKALELNGAELGNSALTVEQPAPKGGASDCAYRGGRGSRGRSGDRGRGEDGLGRGKGKGGAGAPNYSATIASKAKKMTFLDND